MKMTEVSGQMTENRRQKTDYGGNCDRKGDCGLRPIGDNGAYALEGRWKN